ncbi:hypothetical protein SXCC_04476 [Gluconacetobacter sp. SXCC-1]|nr:hypothetical protein SXCC_04476 [Gluconacetobacter sp. SXCC-1]
MVSAARPARPEPAGGAAGVVAKGEPDEFTGCDTSFHPLLRGTVQIDGATRTGSIGHAPAPNP